MPVEQGVKVVVRIKPNQSPEIDSERTSYLEFDESQGTVALDRKQKGVSEFNFSGIVGPSSRQDSLYFKCNLVNDILDGINGCIMAYGQTGSGKTYSMYGRGWDDPSADISIQAGAASVFDSTDVGVQSALGIHGDEDIEPHSRGHEVGVEVLLIIPIINVVNLPNTPSSHNEFFSLLFKTFQRTGGLSRGLWRKCSNS